MSSPVQAELATDDDVYYPSGDDEPMAETTIHVQTIIWLLEALQDQFAAVRDFFAAANLYWYWEKGNNKARRAPDVMAVKGVLRGHRRSFFSWRENNAVPSTIFEIASENTWRENLADKKPLYASLKVQEYFLFDPEYKYLNPALRGFRLNEAGLYVPLEARDGVLRSEELGLFLRGEGPMLRLTDVHTGQLVLTREERAEQAEAEVARLRALLEQTKPGAGGVV